MYYVMSAESVDGGVEPFLHAICENEGDAVGEVARVVKSIWGMDLKRGTNDCDKWADFRYDEDGLVAWNTRDPSCMKSVFAKWVDETRKDLCV